MTSAMSPSSRSFQGFSAPKLLEQMRRAIRVRHYSLRTEEAYLNWVRRFFAFTRRHPRDLESAEINRFLTHLAVEKHVAASTQRQALSAILFLYREVLKIDPPWIDDVVRARQPKRLPTVLSKEEVAALLVRLEQREVDDPRPRPAGRGLEVEAADEVGAKRRQDRRRGCRRARRRSAPAAPTGRPFTRSKRPPKVWMSFIPRISAAIPWAFCRRWPWGIFSSAWAPR